MRQAAGRRTCRQQTTRKYQRPPDTFELISLLLQPREVGGGLGWGATMQCRPTICLQNAVQEQPAGLW